MVGPMTRNPDCSRMQISELIACWGMHKGGLAVWVGAVMNGLGVVFVRRYGGGRDRGVEVALR